MKVSGFDWDDGNWPKCGKHGLSKAEIEAVFHNTPAVYPDPEHSRDEQRLLAIGRGEHGRYVFVAFTIRTGTKGNTIRPISARYMHDREIRNYE